MTLNRRGFFGFLGGAAVAGPKAVKEVASNMANPNLEFPDWPAAPSTFNYVGARTGGGGGPKGPIPEAALRALGLPEWLLDDWRREAREGSRHGLIDPDLMAMRSMSDAAKRAIMYDRTVVERERFFWKERQSNMGLSPRRVWERIYGSVWGYGGEQPDHF